MSADITLDPGSATTAAVQAKADPALVAASASAPAQAVASASPSLPNPRLTVDPSLNRVVLEFFDSSGTLTNTIPSQKQLEAYRLAAFSGQSLAGADPQNG